MSTLAEQQAALVRALVAGGPIPVGMDPIRVEIASNGLVHKRAGEISRYDPAIVYACDGRFHELFDEWARDRPKVSTPADADAFVRHLRSRGVRVRPRKFGMRLRRRG